MGSYITTMELDSRGRYDVKSEVTLRLNSPLTVTADLRLRVLDQSFTKSLTLHPPPAIIMGKISWKDSVVYKGRTHLFEDQLTVGNASLRLSGVQPSDQGQYTCHVTDEQGSTKENLQLLVAAPYDEPRMSVQATCDGFVVTLLASQGFPQPEVL
ncbi:unnamed protein product [Coregonus sp. 'balchen']|nr:unnamed protein product [Coregonus sp. 'balchen']